MPIMFKNYNGRDEKTRPRKRGLSTLQFPVFRSRFYPRSRSALDLREWRRDAAGESRLSRSRGLTHAKRIFTLARKTVSQIKNFLTPRPPPLSSDDLRTRGMSSKSRQTAIFSNTDACLGGGDVVNTYTIGG